jgi:hypothetical protein
LKLFFHEASFGINTLFPPLHEIQYADCAELFAEASKLFMHAVFQHVIAWKTVSLECILQVAKGWKLEGAKSGL